VHGDEVQLPGLRIGSKGRSLQSESQIEGHPCKWLEAMRVKKGPNDKMKDIALETLLSNARRLSIFTWLTQGIMTACLVAIAFVVEFKGERSSVSADWQVYLLLALAAIVPLFGLIVAREAIVRYRKGISASKTPWHLFLSVSVFQMFMISIIYVLAVVSCLHARDFRYMLYFYAVAAVWWIFCWPRERAFQRLLRKLSLPESGGGH
jgi:hypothetical protein